MIVLPKEDQWVEWIGMPQTQALIRYAKLRRKDFMESWAAGGFADDIALNLKALAECQVLQVITELDFQTIVTSQGDSDEE